MDVTPMVAAPEPRIGVAGGVVAGVTTVDVMVDLSAEVVRGARTKE